MLVDCQNVWIEKNGNKEAKLNLWQIIDNTELSNTSDHICIKASNEKAPEHKIKESLAVLKEKEAKWPKTDKELAAEELHQKNLEEIRNKVEWRNYDKMVEKS